MATTTHHMKTGDLEPSIAATLTYSDGTVVDLTAATTPRFLMRAHRAAALTVDGTATVVNAAAGTVRYDWASGDTDTAGLYRAEWEFSIGGKKMTVPNDGYLYVVIRDDLG
jgi:hypothetical protein